ncbi:uncharacterized protein LOC116207146 [Punica granatum]|uniref:Uncharacterized protein LOC116207146 n=1 Tax=Punica granatum TaxID=22663 RepID=A0A6P8DN94_PUNGR|nr:uncharacterized protein LOC116207146 [Punica granatum]
MGDFGGQVGSTATENHHGSRLRIQFWGETGFVRMRAWHFIMAGLMRRQIGSLANEPGPEPEASLVRSREKWRTQESPPTFGDYSRSSSPSLSSPSLSSPTLPLLSVDCLSSPTLRLRLSLKLPFPENEVQVVTYIRLIEHVKLCRLLIASFYEVELELADFKECLNVLYPSANTLVHSLSKHCQDSRSKGSSQKSSRRSAKELDVRDHLLEDEIKRLKQEYDALVLGKNAKISALLTEKKFVWNQYKILETKLNDKLKSKEAEIQLANEKVSRLLVSMEKLQSSNDAKDEVIAKLESKIADKEALARKRRDELVRLAHELELLKRARCTSETPVLSRCTTSGSITSSLGNKKGTHVPVNKPPTAAQVSNSMKNSERVLFSFLDGLMRHYFLLLWINLNLCRYYIYRDY